MKHVVSASSGCGSAYTWHLIAKEHGPDNVIALFADVNGEHPDNYRFLAETHRAIGGELVVLDNGGQTIWDIMKKNGFLANSRVDICSRLLKRRPILSWLKKNCDPNDTTVYLGIDWTEAHRYEQAKARWAVDGWQIGAPMCDGFLDKAHALAWLKSIDIEPPLLTRLGFPHANCGGGCVKAGIKHFKHLLDVLPDSFAEWEAHEDEMRSLLGDDVTILRDRRGKTAKPLPLKKLRWRVETGPAYFLTDDEWGACGCFTGSPDE